MSIEHGEHPDDDLLIALVLDELTREERDRVELHLAGCGDCRGVAAALAGSIEGLRGAPRPGAPADILVELMEAQAATRADRRWGWWSRLRRGQLVPAPALAVFLVLLLAAFWAGRRSVPSSMPAAHQPDVGRGSGALVVRELPRPPRIPFQAAAVFDST